MITKTVYLSLCSVRKDDKSSEGSVTLMPTQTKELLKSTGVYLIHLESWISLDMSATWGTVYCLVVHNRWDPANVNNHQLKYSKCKYFTLSPIPIPGHVQHHMSLPGAGPPMYGLRSHNHIVPCHQYPVTMFSRPMRICHHPLDQ